MSSIFQNENGTWNYGNNVYGSLSDAENAERKERQRISSMFTDNSSRNRNAKTTDSSDSTIGAIIKLGLFIAVCYFLVKYWYIVVSIVVLVLIFVVIHLIKKSHKRKAAVNIERMDAYYQKGDYESVFTLLKENSDKYKDPESMYQLAFAYKDGEGTTSSEEEYMNYLKKSARYGYSLSQYLYGSIIVFNEESTEKEKKAGFNYLKKSVKDLGSPYINSYRHNLAVAYLHGCGTKKNEKKGKKILEELAAAGDSKSKEILDTIKQNIN